MTDNLAFLNELNLLSFFFFFFLIIARFGFLLLSWKIFPSVSMKQIYVWFTFQVLLSKLCKSHKINRELFSNFLFLKKDYIYLFERESERERAWAGWRAEGERESQADSVPSTEPNAGLHLTTLRSWPEPKSRVGRLTDWATQVPPVFYFKRKCRRATGWLSQLSSWLLISVQVMI